MLQNQGSMRVALKGHVLMSETAIEQGDMCDASHAFPDDVTIPPGVYVLLVTGQGEPRWTRTKDGASVYYTYMNKRWAIWRDCKLPLHVLNTQHTYEERGERLLLK